MLNSIDRVPKIGDVEASGDVSLTIQDGEFGVARPTGVARRLCVGAGLEEGDAA